MLDARNNPGSKWRDSKFVSPNMILLARLFLVSVTTLYLEMLLIRWISTEIRIFAYLQSSVLIACLMGLGMGCYNIQSLVRLRRTYLPVLSIAVVLSVPVFRERLSAMAITLAEFGDFHVWASSSVMTLDGLSKALYIMAALISTGFILLIVWIAFIPLGQLVGGIINRCEQPIAAYSVNIAGSLVGIGLFTALSAMQTPPIIWLLILSVLFILISLAQTEGLKLNLALITLIPIVASYSFWQQTDEKTIWSPYQKLTMKPVNVTDPISNHQFNLLNFSVNNTFYQVILDLNPETLKKGPGLYPEKLIGLSQYDLPFLIKPKAKKVLILGAGTGNDVAGALRNNAGEITAVEIDPVILEFGKRYHFEAPYQKPNVKLIIDDARSFMAVTESKYDLISFGLLDSHTSGTMTNARLDNFVYTIESIQRTKQLLSPGGVLTLMFEANKQFLINRIANTLKQVFDQKPVIFRIPTSAFGVGGVMFVVGDAKVISDSFKSNTSLSGHVATLKMKYPLKPIGTARLTTDNWPYLYLPTNQIPLLFGVLAVMFSIIFFACGRYTGIAQTMKNWTRNESHFFLLGAAFMLLEVMMISKSAVVIGNVWTVNAVVIAGILGMILAANIVKHKWRNLPIPLVYIMLLASCTVLYFFDLAELVHLPYAQKVVALGVMSAFPMFFSGIIFIDSFNQTTNKARALGANLFGALAGGLLQIVTFATGLQFLMFLVGMLYFMAAATVRFKRIQYLPLLDDPDEHHRRA